ncbi:MAG: hypothetical protein KBC35_02875 [Candidatus Pacebacteria bacterium]|nr:hypothetical protein [Candidatus Paceibacterota bacterium]
MPRIFLAVFIQAGVATILIMSIIGVGLAQVSTSTNYQIQSDSLNFGGGLSTSTNYRQESTAGEVATGPSDSATYALRAGYQQMQEVYLSLTVTGDVIMSPSLPGVTGGTANGSTTFTVLTDDPAGYQLTLESENSPAMQSGIYSIADYNAGIDADFSFVTGGGEAYFGFTPEGVDIPQAFLDDGGTCGVDTQDSSLACWVGASTTAQMIALGSGANHPDGATTTVHFRVGVGSNAGVIAGVYTATTTVTVLPL